MKSKIKIFLWVLLFPTILLTGCAKNEVYYLLDENANKNDNGSDNANTSDQAYQVYFNALMESMKTTKAIFAFPANRYATVFVYDSGNATTGVPLEKANYKTLSAGSLTPVNTHIALPNGKYDFYSVATNSSTNQTPTFSNGTSSPLTNGIDYLWWMIPEYEINSTPANVHIIYNHSCSQVLISIAGGDGITVNSVDSVKLTPPAPTSTMDLGTGIIPSVTSLASSYINMGIAKSIAQITVLPLKTSSSIPVIFKITINNESSPRTYQVNMPVPGDALIAGNSYLFKAVVNATTVSFPEVSVISWVTVDEEGKPLYPDEID